MEPNGSESRVIQAQSGSGSRPPGGKSGYTEKAEIDESDDLKIVHQDESTCSATGELKKAGFTVEARMTITQL